MVISTEAAKRSGKFLPLARDTEVNNVVLVYTKTEIIEYKNMIFNSYCYQ